MLRKSPAKEGPASARPLTRRRSCAAPTPPVLRVAAVGSLVLHEEPDPGRVARLQEALRRDGVVRNPPIVAALPAGGSVVLDGANRVTALREMGVPHAVVQVVDYARPEIELTTWRHYVRAGGAPALRPRAASLPWERVSSILGTAEGEAALARRRAWAMVADRGGAVLLGGAEDALSAAGLLRRLVALYRGEAEIYRVEGGDRDALAAEYGPGSLVVFPPFGKDEILTLAGRGGRLPTGITRHVIPGRALRVNARLDWLASSDDRTRKEADLAALLSRRAMEHGVRYYTESTVLFDE